MNGHENDLLMEHYDRIKRYIAYKAGIDQAEDLTQQVFLKANQSLNSFQNKSSLYTWLYSIASNIMMNEARRAYRTRELPVGQETGFSRFITTDFLTILVPNNDDGSLRYSISTYVECAQVFKSANPGIEVTIVTMPIPDFQGAKFLERISGSNAVDLVFWPYDTAFSRQGLFADLLHFYKEDGITPDGFYKPLTELTTEDGQLTGLPLSPQPLAVFYNRDWFNEANLPEPTEDWTWEQFFAMSVHLKEANAARGKEIYGSAVPIIPDLLESFAQSNGGSMLSPDNSRFTGFLDSRPVIEAFALLSKNSQDVVKKVPDGTSAIISEGSSSRILSLTRKANSRWIGRNRECLPPGPPYTSLN